MPNQVAEMVQNVGKGLAMIAQLMQQTGAPEGALQKMQQVIAGYEDVISDLTGEGGERRPMPASQGTVSPEAGAYPGARPA